MTKNDAHDLLRQHMDAHGLQSWSIAFTGKKRQLGSCNHHKKRISLSEVYIAHNAYPQILDTILHEIAHAVLPAHVLHGPAWKAKARELGATPSPYQVGAVIPRAFKGTCPGCGKVTLRHRRSDCSCSRCSNGTYNPKFKITWERNAEA